MFFAKKIQEAGADAIELNLFILPSDFDANCTKTEDLYFDIIKKVKVEVSIPIAVKISYYSSNLAAFVKRVSESDVDGIVLFNRFFHPDFDIDKFEIIPSNVLSNPSDLAISLRWIAIMSGRVSCDLIASTGVHDGASLIKQLLAGADSVQIASALYSNGVEYVTVILDELKEWMKKHKFKSISEFRGKMSQPNRNGKFKFFNKSNTFYCPLVLPVGTLGTLYSKFCNTGIIDRHRSFCSNSGVFSECFHLLYTKNSLSKKHFLHIRIYFHFYY